ncbi:transcriptional regulator, ArsR family [Seinonella peptonophila]|uniref:Transcriptional regulator, ArsR family n=1 Tax=Seinonella peptonophila TaxID=112248 RepID=A0A1M4SW99_9BACL|nr:metalloregulator ArsR/SmtB family transcription factor [Seinonella peptonophila]SHE36486.1 transcriptional regulator, ArsR family [Seinonella peptonophila]
MSTIVKEVDTCEITVIHEEQVQHAKESMLPEDQIARLSTVFQAFSDPTRLRILHSLRQNEMCVCDLAASLEMTQSAVSHQLRKLKQARMVSNRKEGRTVYYRLHDEHVETLLQTSLFHILHT